MNAVSRIMARYCPATLTGLLPILSVKSRLKQKNGRTAEKNYIFVSTELLLYGLKKNPYFSQLPNISFANAAIQTTFLRTVLLVIPKFFGASPMQGW
ncbi:hypothetical protein [Desulfovibrio sp.]|uniref:hypothetical protein n=1 Tax=Desulfovibrio sp. TaxID=885 RepID=UPI003D14D2C4